MSGGKSHWEILQCTTSPDVTVQLSKQSPRYNVTDINERIKRLAELTTDAFSDQDDYKDFKAV